MNGTPRTDQMEQHAPVGLRRNSAFEQASDLCRQLERELNRACEMYRKLDIHTLDLVDRIIRLEAAGDAMVSHAKALGMDGTGLVQRWHKAKEAKP